MRRLIPYLLAVVALPWAALATAADAACQATRAETWMPATGVADPDGDVRVFAIQFKQEIRHVETLETFRTKIVCVMDEQVVPHLPPDADGDGRGDVPTIVVFNEDIGLATIASGIRGTAARAFATYGPKDPVNIPGALGSFALVGAAYAPAVARVLALEPDTSPQRAILAAATDTFARVFMETFSQLARRYGVYVVASNNQAEFARSSAVVDVIAFTAPERATQPLEEDGSVYVPVDDDRIPETIGVGRGGIDVTNQAWMWAPTDQITDYARATFEPVNGAPLLWDDPRANVIHRTKKTPLTAIEQNILDLSDDRDMSIANTGPFCLPVADDPGCRAKIGYGISLPGFMWGTAFGQPFTGEPCASPVTWMRCLDARGTAVFLQPEANSGRWADYIDLSWTPAAYQSLSWLDSAWRAVADPTVQHIRYAITPHLVGNLVDLTFDGQSVIFERCIDRGDHDTCSGNVPATFVGASVFEPCGPSIATRCDGPMLAPYAGPHAETIIQAPWVLADCPMCLGPIKDRERLAAHARALEAGTGSPSENDYLETAIWADLDLD